MLRDSGLCDVCDDEWGQRGWEVAAMGLVMSLVACLLWRELISICGGK